MSEHNDGGPAFPGWQFRTVQRVGEEPRDIPAGPQGMSLRDWFAGQALVGLLSKFPIIDQSGRLGIIVDDVDAHNQNVAESCYAIADAMLAARKAKP